MMESKNVSTKQWTEPDGSTVIETITTVRQIIPKGFQVPCSIQSTNEKEEEQTNETVECKDDNDDNESISEGYHGNNFEQQALDRHNYYRAKHGCPKLVLSKEICQYAQQWAQYLANSRKMQHRQERKYGENIFMCSGSFNGSINGNEPVDMWYKEIQQYNYNYPGFQSNTGHFSQVIWRDSKRMGIGVARQGSSFYVVANYDPPGNINTKENFVKNVPPPK